MREEIIGGQRLICGDCLEVLPDIPAETGTVITDPPYGTATADWDKDPPPDVWATLKRIASGKPIAVFGYPECHLRWAQFFAGLRPLTCIAWWHYNHPTRTSTLTRHWQQIVVWGTAFEQVRANDVREPYPNASDCAKWCSENNVTALPQGFNARGRRLPNLWRIASPGVGFNSHLRQHPNEKPLEVMERLVRLLTQDGETVVDPYCGSGSTLVAAELWGRHGIGIEQDHTHFDVACRRVEEAVRKREAEQAQLTLTEATA